MNPAKALGQLLGGIRALPHLLGYRLAHPILGPQRAITGASERIGKLPGQIGIYARQTFYRRVLGGVGNDVYFGFMTQFSKSAAVIGDRAYIGRFCTLGWVELGDDVMLADGVQVLSGRHQHGDKDNKKNALEQDSSEITRRDLDQEFNKVTIGKGAWIGAGAIVMADVGAAAVVGAGAVVVKPVAEGIAVGGVPARPLGSSG